MRRYPSGRDRVGAGDCGIRAVTVSDRYTVRQSVEHDDLNVLCLGAQVGGPELAYEQVRAFADATSGVGCSLPVSSSAWCARTG